jgi:hypothetical protein
MPKSQGNEVDQPSVRKAALMWISFIYTQATRLEDAVDTYTELEITRQLVATYEARGRPAEWANQVRKARRRLKRRRPPTVAADKYFFLLSVAQLVKCARLLPADGLPNFDDSELIRHLRNIEEHWEQADGRSLSALRQSIPDIAPGRVTFTKKDIWFETISFVNVLRWTRAVELRLRSTENSDNNHPLDPSANPSFPDGTRALWATLTGQFE